MWRAALDLADNGDESILDVWHQADDEEWQFDVSTEIYGEIANGSAMTIEGAKAKALEAWIPGRIVKEHMMRVNVKKWGNSASVRIPAPILDAAQVRVDDTVDVRAEDGKIVIELVRETDYDLDQLLDGPVGKEAL